MEWSLYVTCHKDGFRTETQVRASRLNMATFGNIVAGGLIGAIVDEASGANYNYSADIMIQLVAVPAWVGAAPAPGSMVRPRNVKAVFPMS